MTWRGRAVALLTAVASLAGCSGGWCDFCAVATMRVAGSVVHQDGEVYAHAPIHWTCGVESADGFGGTLAAGKDGSFSAELPISNYAILPEDPRGFRCRFRISAPLLDLPESSVTTWVPLGDERPPVQLEIRVGAVVDLTGGRE